MNRPATPEQDSETRTTSSLFDLFFRSRRARRIQATRDHRAGRKRPLFESLESRLLMSADVAVAFQGLDGMLASVQNGLAGVTDTPLPLIGSSLSSAAGQLNDTIQVLRDNVTGRIADEGRSETAAGVNGGLTQVFGSTGFNVLEGAITTDGPAPTLTFDSSHGDGVYGRFTLDLHGNFNTFNTSGLTLTDGNFSADIAAVQQAAFAALGAQGRDLLAAKTPGAAVTASDIDVTIASSNPSGPVANVFTISAGLAPKLGDAALRSALFQALGPDGANVLQDSGADNITAADLPDATLNSDGSFRLNLGGTATAAALALAAGQSTFGGAQTAVELAVFQQLSPLGLVDRTGDGVVTAADVAVVIQDTNGDGKADVFTIDAKLASPLPQATLKAALVAALGPSGLNIVKDTGRGNVTEADIPLTGASNTDNLALSMTLGQNLLTLDTPIAFDIGLDALGLDLGIDQGQIQLSVGWQAKLGFGFNAQDGFFFDVSAPSEAQLNVQVTLSDITKAVNGVIPDDQVFKAHGTLGPLQVTAEDFSNPNDISTLNPLGYSGVFGTIFLDLTGPDGEGLLPLNQLDQVGVHAGLSAAADLNLHLKAGFGSDVGGTGVAVFPTLGTDLHVNWDFLDAGLSSAGPQGVEVTPLNNTLRVSDDGSGTLDRTVTLNPGIYTGDELANELERALNQNRDPANTQAYVVLFDSDGKLKIGNPQGNAHDLLLGFNDSFTTAGTLLGGQGAVDVPNSAGPAQLTSGAGLTELQDKVQVDVISQVTTANNKLVINDGGADRTITLAQGRYTGEKLAAELQHELNSNRPIGATNESPYTVTFENGHLDIANPKDNTASLILKFDAAATTAAAVLGGAPRTGSPKSLTIAPDSDEAAPQRIGPGGLAATVSYGNSPLVEFNDITVDLGSFLSDFVGPILGEIKDVLDPVMPLIDALRAPIPVLPELIDQFGSIGLPTIDAGADGDPSSTSLIDLASAIPSGTVPKLDFVLKVVNLLTLLSSLPDVSPDSSDNLVLHLGSFKLTDSAGNPLDLKGKSSLDEVTPGQTQAADVSDEIASSSTSVGKFSQKSGDSGLVFPLLKSDTALTTAINLLLGKPTDLFQLNLPEFVFGFNLGAIFAIFPPFLKVGLNGNFSADINFDFGFDTSGILDYEQSGNLTDIFNSFYVSDHLVNGVDEPEVSFHAGLTASASLNAVIAEAGVEGGISGDVTFNLHDPNQDGKVHLNELEQRFALAPWAIFDVHGAVNYSLDAYVWVGLKIDLLFDSYTITLFEDSFDLASGTLVDFDYSLPDQNIQPDLADLLPDGTLRLNMGSNAHFRGAGDLGTDGDENFTVGLQAADANKPIGGDNVDMIVVNALGFSQSFRASDVQRIYGDGGNGDDRIVIAASKPGKPGITVPVELHGGAGDDVLMAGDGPATLYGDAGNDQLWGSNQADKLYGGSGDDALFGQGGNDQLYGGTGNDKMIGGDGDDLIVAGDSFDPNTHQVFYDARFDPVTGAPYYDAGVVDPKLLTSTGRMDGGNGNDTLYGGSGNDRLRGGAGNDFLFAGAGDDSLSGEGGNDTLYGDAGADTLSGGSGDDLLFGDATDIALAGDAGNDILHVPYGNALIDGGTGSDTLIVSDDGRGAAAFVLARTTADAGTLSTTRGSTSTLIAFTGITHLLEVDLPNVGSTLDIQGTIAAGALIEGGAGDDQISIEALQGAATLDLGAGDDEVTLGNNGSLVSLDAPLTVLGGSGDDKLVYDMSNEPSNLLLMPEVPLAGGFFGVNGLVLGSDLVGATSLAIRYDAGVDAIQLELRPGSNRVDVTDPRRIIIVDGGAADAVHLTLTSAPGVVPDAGSVVTQGVGSVFFTYGASEEAWWLMVGQPIEPGSQLRLVTAAAFADGNPDDATDRVVLQTRGATSTLITLGDSTTGIDHLKVVDIDTPTMVDLRHGNDEVIVVLPAAAQGSDGTQFTGIGAALTLVGGGTQTLQLVDPEGVSAGQTATLDGNVVRDFGMPAGVSIGYSGFANLVIDAQDNSGYQLTILDTAIATRINLGSGDDTLTVRGLSNATTVNLGGGNDVATIVAAAAASLNLIGGDAQLQTNLAGAESNLVFTAVGAYQGANGKSVRICYVAGGSSSPLSVNTDTSAGTITVGLATDSTGAVISTARDVRDAINADPSASGIVSAAFAPGVLTGAGKVAAFGFSHLDYAQNDTVVFDGSAQTVALSGSLLDSAGGQTGTLAVANLVSALTFQDFSHVQVRLGSNSDTFTLDEGLVGADVAVSGNAGDDQIDVKRIGGGTSVDGGSGADTVTLDIADDDPTAQGFRGLTLSLESLVVDNHLYQSPVAWLVGGDVLSAATIVQGSLLQYSAMVGINGVSEVRVSAAPSSGSTLDISETTGAVTGSIDGNVVDLQRGSTVLDPSGLNDTLSGQNALQSLTNPQAMAYAPGSDSTSGFVYVRDADGSLTVFQDGNTFSPVQVLSASTAGLGGGTGNQTAIAIDPVSHRYLYTSTSTGSQIAVFQRDTATGQLLPAVQLVAQGAGGITGLTGVTSLAISPDGKNLYAAGSADNALVVFSIDPTSGMLTEQQVLKQGQADLSGAGVQGVAVTGLTGISRVDASDDGTRIYALAANGKIAVFHRDSADGHLSFDYTLGLDTGSSTTRGLLLDPHAVGSEAEPNDEAAQAFELKGSPAGTSNGRNLSNTSTIGTIGSAADVDFYKLEAAPGNTLTVSLAGIGSSALTGGQVLLLDRNGMVLSSGSSFSYTFATVAAAPTTAYAGDYFLVVKSSSGATGGYQLSTSVASDPSVADSDTNNSNNSTTSATNLTDHFRSTGGGAFQATATGSLVDTLSATQNVALNANLSASPDPRDDGNGQTLLGGGASVAVNNPASSPGHLLTTQEAQNIFNTSFWVNKPFNDTLAGPNGNGDAVWSATMARGTMVQQIVLTNLYTLNGTTLKINVYNNGVMTTLQTSARAGAGQGNSTSLTIPVNATADKVEIVLSGASNSVISLGRVEIDGQSATRDADFFRVHAEAGDTINAALAAVGTANPSVSLVNAGGATLSSGGSTLTSTVSASGDYFLVVQASNAGLSGTYTLTSTLTKGSRPTTSISNVEAMAEADLTVTGMYDTRFLYIGGSSAAGQPTLQVLDVNQGHGQPKVVQSISGLGEVFSVQLGDQVDASGNVVAKDKYLYVGHRVGTTDQITVFERQDNGTLVQGADFSTLAGADFSHPILLVPVSSDRVNRVYVANETGQDVLSLGRVGTTSGSTALNFQGEFAHGDAIAGGLSELQAVTSSGALVYGVNTDGSALLVLNASDLSTVQALQGVDGLKGAVDVVVRPPIYADAAASSPNDPKRVYVAAAGDDSIGIFASDPSTNRLTGSSPVSVSGLGLGTIQTLAVSSVVDTSVATGAFLYAGFDGGLARFDASGATLGSSPKVAALAGAGIQAIAVSSDGQSVYALGAGTLYRFAADLSGTPQILSAGLAGASALALSPDNKQLYVTVGGAGKVLVYNTGASGVNANPVQQLQQGFSGVRGITGADGVAVSADGAYVYVTGGTGNSLAVFARDANVGVLQLVQVFSNRGSLGLGGPNSVTVATLADGTEKVVVGYATGLSGASGGVSSFAREALISPPAHLVVSFDNMAALTLETGDADDQIRIANPAPVTTTTIDTGAGADTVVLQRLGGTTNVDTGAGNDTIDMRSSDAIDQLTIEAGADDDLILVGRTGTGTAAIPFQFSGGTGNDVFQVAGSKLGSALSLDGGDGQDTLRFDSAGNGLTPATPIVPAGTIARAATGGASFQTVNYASIESIPGFHAAEVNAGGSYTISEGQSLSLNASATPAVIDSQTIPIVSTLWDIDGDGSFGEITGASPTLTWEQLKALGLNDGTASGTVYDIALRVVDANGNFADDQATVKVLDTPPQIQITSAPPASIAVGTPYVFGFSHSDPGADLISGWEVNWGDGNLDKLASDAAEASHIYLDTGTFAPTLVAVDGDSGSLSTTPVTPGYVTVVPAVQVTPATPTISSAGSASDLHILEGQGIALQASAPGNATFTWDLNHDGTFGDEAHLSLSAGGSLLTLSWDDLVALGIGHTGTYAVDAKAVYSDAGTGTPDVSAAAEVTLTVDDVAPTAQFGLVSPAAGTAIHEGDPVVVGFTGATDPAQADVAAGFSFSYDFNNDGDFADPGEIQNAAGLDSASVPLSYLSHTPNQPFSDDGTYLVHGRITDQAGGYTDYTTSVTVANVPPVLALNGAGSVTEGTPYTLTLGATDPGADTVGKWIVNWGDGGPTDAITTSVKGETPTLTHVFADDKLGGVSNATFNITATALDEDGVYSVSKQVSVANVAPTLNDLSVTPSVPENGIATLTGNIVDPGTQDAFTLVVNWGDGSKPETFSYAAGTTAFGQAHRYLNDAPTPDHITAILTDDSGGSDTKSTDVSVTDVPAHLQDLQVTPAIAENDVATLTGSIVDPGTLDAFTLQVNWGDATTLETFSYSAGTTGFTQTHRYLDDAPNPYVITASLADDRGAGDSATTSVKVSNLAPTFVSATPGGALVNAPVIDENGVAVLTGQFADVGTLDTHALTVSWGDGLTSNAVIDGAHHTYTAQHQYLDNPAGSADDKYAVLLTLSDDDGGVSTLQSLVTVHDVAPILTGVSATSVSEGGTTTLTGKISDPGTLDSFTLAVDWGDTLSPNDVARYTFATGTTVFTLTHKYLDDNPSGTSSDVYTVNLTVADKDGGASTNAAALTVTNVAPVVTSFAVSAPTIGAGAAGIAVSASGTFSDVGVLDTHTAMIDWGDGVKSAATIVESNGAGSLTGTHSYASGGTFAVTLSFADDDGGTASAAASAVISGASVINGVLQIIGTAGNDSVNVTKPLDPVAYWNLNEKSGSTIHDTAGTPQNGVFFGPSPDLDDRGPSVSFGAQTAADFHGTTKEYIGIADDATFQLPEGTIQLWFDARNTSGQQALFSKDRSGVGAGRLDIRLDGERLQVTLESATGTYVIRTGKIVDDDQWNQLSFTFGPQGMKLYLNGDLVGQNAYTGGLQGNREAIVIGGAEATNKDTSGNPAKLKVTDPFDGWIDEVAVFDKALDAGQVSASMASGARGVTDPKAPFIEVQASFISAPGGVLRFSAADIHSIAVSLGAGNDQARIDASVVAPVVIDGGTGNDVLTAGSGPTTLIGGDGNDTLTGGPARDMLLGGAGNDILTGGGGNDVIDGGAGFDTVAGLANNCGGRDPGLSGAVADYRFAFVSGALQITDERASGDGTDLYQGVELIAFRDGTNAVVLGAGSSMGSALTLPAVQDLARSGPLVVLGDAAQKLQLIGSWRSTGTVRVGHTDFVRYSIGFTQVLALDGIKVTVSPAVHSVAYRTFNDCRLPIALENCGDWVKGLSSKAGKLPLIDWARTFSER